MNIKSFSSYLTETTLSRQWETFATDDRVSAIISASRHERTPRENVAATRALAAQVRRLGYGFVYASGHYIEAGAVQSVPVEETVLIISGPSGSDRGRLKGYLRQWCREIPQEAAVYKPEGSTHVYLVSADDADRDLGVFHPQRVSDFMTKLRGRGARTFVFESAYYQMTFFEALAAKVRK
jgi:hypothetical protein